MIDSGNPCIYVRAEDVGLSGHESPDEIDGNASVMQILENTRRAASVKMGLADTPELAGNIQSVPKIAVVSKPRDYTTLSGENIAAVSYDISVRMISMGQAHRAIPVTGALCVATALRLGNTVLPVPEAQGIKIGTPSGVLEVDAIVDLARAGHPHVKQASIWRSTRRLMEGLVLVPKEKLER